MLTEVLVEVWRITDEKEGAVYKTEFTGERRWVDYDAPRPAGFIYVAVSGPGTIRVKKES